MYVPWCLHAVQHVTRLVTSRLAFNPENRKLRNKLHRVSKGTSRRAYIVMGRGRGEGGGGGGGGEVGGTSRRARIAMQTQSARFGFLPTCYLIQSKMTSSDFTFIMYPADCPRFCVTLSQPTITKTERQAHSHILP